MKYLKLFVVFGALALVGAGSATLLDVFGTVSGTADVKPALKISEVLYDTVNEDDAGEKIEIYNPSSASVTLTNFEVSDGKENETLEGLNGTQEISSGEYVVVVGTGYSGEFQDGVNYFEVDDSTIGSNNLANTGGSIYIWSDSIQIDSTSYDGSCDEGDSAQRDSLETNSLSCASPNFGSGDLS